MKRGQSRQGFCLSISEEASVFFYRSWPCIQATLDMLHTSCHILIQAEASHGKNCILIDINPDKSFMH